MTASQTTLNVSSATGFPTSAFTIRIDDEFMTVTAGFGTTTWTVTRGAKSSAAAAHVNGAERGLGYVRRAASSPGMRRPRR